MGAVVVLILLGFAIALDALGIIGVVGRFAEAAFLVVPGIFMVSLVYGLPSRKRG
jgi:hypothetical protein